MCVCSACVCVVHVCMRVKQHSQMIRALASGLVHWTAIPVFCMAARGFRLCVLVHAVCDYVSVTMSV